MARPLGSPLLLVAIQSALCCFLCDAHLHGSSSLLVNTTLGRVRGVLQNGRRIFRGIPYAAPPTGDLRFRPPAPHVGWTEVLEASDFGPACLQYQGGCWESSNVSIQSEDCLTINVMTPEAPPPSQGYAVLFFIHAGEFRCGTANDRESNWPSFGDKLVYVSINYRIGALGFLSDSSLRARDPLGGTGNYGLLDQRFAMRWVQDNIAAFGGNPSDVTITGESSGGTSVAFHLLAAGRGQGQPFKKAILQSPGLGQVKEWQEAEINTEFTLAALAAAGSPHCHHAFGYIALEKNVLAVRAPLHVKNSTDLVKAKTWCNGHPNCTGFMISAATGKPARRLEDFGPTRYSNQTVFISGTPTVFDLQAQDLPSFPTVYLKQGPLVESRRELCLVSADARLLADLTGSLPKDDTFYTDGWAPVIDDVILPSPIEDQLDNAPRDVDVLLGSNLDEGTEFMDLAPRIACNASAEDFRRWVVSFLGADMLKDVELLYSPANLTRPLPACQKTSYMGTPEGPKLSGEEAVYYNAAMRIAGDVSVVCPTHSLARAVKGRAFNYRFLMTPTFSWNFPDTSIMGAFHGADVPFVTSAVAELNTTAERNLSGAMSCFWSSFIRNGEPSKDACSSDVTWPAFEDPQEMVMNLGPDLTSQTQSALAAERCSKLDAAVRNAVSGPAGLGRRKFKGPRHNYDTVVI